MTKFQSAQQMINDEIRETHIERANASDVEKVAIDAELDELIEKLARFLK